MRDRVDVLDAARTIVAFLARTVAQVEPESLGDDDAPGWLALAGEIERLGAGLRVVVADRAAQASSWTEEGHRSPAAWVAEVVGTTVGEARSTLSTSQQLEHLAETRRVASLGALSATQLTVIARAATEDPTREHALLEAAAELSTEELKRVARSEPPPDAAATAAPPTERLRTRRYLRLWSDTEGRVRLSGAFGTDEGAALVAAVRSRAAFVADEALAAGLEPEPSAAYDADALVALATGDVRQATFAGNVGGGGRTATLVLHASIDALRRGEALAGEPCEIVGIGAVAPTVVEGMAGESALRLLVEEGADVVALADLGTVVPHDVRGALKDRDRVCVVPGCAVALSLRTDFWQVPFGRGGPAELWNLARLCGFHHRLKNSEGYELAGGPGRWEWRAPP